MSEPAMPELVVERAGAVMWVTLNRPARLNALTAELVSELQSAVHAAASPDVRAVVVTGAGRAFCAGSDLRANFGPGATPTEVTLRCSRHPLLLALRALPKPVITAVNGVAAGIGVGLALAGDVVVMRRSATLSLSFANLGLVPDGGVSWHLSRALGRARSLRAALLGETIDGPTALAWGLVSSCVDDALFDDEVRELAERLAAGPSRAYGLMKQAFDAAPSSSLAQHLELEARLQAEATATADFDEGLQAWLARRAPQFAGR
ncbi:MAG TPA: enoyl-CoA hydratase-related protein [Capillimicrobium sp.]|nr:enoyl-CoA hydratase-related protein [Capillimicrobium sp.]